jgi:alpha galactosidase A-like protein/alpha galactosidase C-like protein/fibronectin type III domain protein/alpha-galactosidase-like protein
MRRILALLAVVLAVGTAAIAVQTRLAPPALALDDGLALTPPMGWNDWNAFGCNVSAQLVEQTALAMHNNGMQQAGYDYVNIDDCWAESQRDSDGNLVPDPTKFPDGIKAVADYVHSLGMKLGIYEDSGTHTCSSHGFPGSLGHEYQDALTFAEWGVDYLKYDDCNIPASGQNVQATTQRYDTMRDALLAARAKTGHAIVFSICEKTDYGVPNSTWPPVGNLWRTTGDIHDTYASMLSNFTQNVQLSSLAHPGAWNDPDMLEVGNGGMSVTEEQTEFSLWAEMAAPLIAGTDLRDASAQTLATYENHAVIAVDQDPLGEQGYPVQDANGLWVLTKPLASGDRAVVLFNSTDAPAAISTTAAQAGLGAAPSYTLTDLWQGGTSDTTGAIGGMVPAHGVLMYDVAPSQASFTYSHLRVTPPRLANRVSGPQAPGGQSAALATVRATVTNTGTATGPGTAELWLTAPGGDPVLAGDQTVNLAPGQSAAVTFRLTGRDLSAWGDAAQGWVVPDGKFAVGAGGSAGDLPLTGTLDVTRSIGARYATITGPSGPVAPESTVAVTATFTNAGDYAMLGTRFGLDVPTGWSARLARPAPLNLAAGKSVTVRWLVRVPVTAQNSAATLTARLTSAPAAGGAGSLTAATAVTVEPALTVTASPVSLVPGESGSSTFTVTSNLPDTVTLGYTASPPAGITVTPAQGTLTVPVGGASTTVAVSAAGSAAGGLTPVPLTLNFSERSHSYSLSATQIPVTVPYPSFSAAYDNDGISDDTDTAAANIDGAGSSFSAQALASAGVTPGASLSYDGLTFGWPSAAAGQPDNVVAAGQTIDISGSGSSLGLLDTAAYGPAAGTGAISYSDGTTQSFSLSVPNWYKAAPAGSNAVIVAPYRNRRSNTQDQNVVNIFEQSVPLQPGKQVVAVTLPDISNGVVSGSPSLHVFAMAIGG